MDYFNLASLMVKWVIDRPARLVLRGYRPEMICLIRNTAEPDKYLLIRSQAHKSHWAPPQEGMKLNESIESALNRCLNAEEYHTRILTNPADKQEILRKAWALIIGE